MTVFREGTVYLQMRPHGGWQLRVMKATQRPPSTVDADCVVVKMRVRIPDRAFLPLQPEAVVTVPEELVQHLIQVEAVDPS